MPYITHPLEHLESFMRRRFERNRQGEMIHMDLTDRETTLLKRELKKAKVYEVRRIVRRIRQLKNKKGTSAEIEKNNRKASRFEKELEFIKEANVLEILNQISGSDSEGERLDKEDLELKKRALQRIVDSAPIQHFLSKKDAGELEKDTKHATRVQNRFLRDSVEKNEGEEGLSSPVPKGKQEKLASVFLTSLSSTSEGSHKQVSVKPKEKEKSKGKSKKTKEKGKLKNRMGQRSRKKMWESMYGSKAKHVIKEKVQSGKTGNKKLSTSDKPKSRQKIPPNKKDSLEDKLHPSWQATKKRKLEQSINVEFKGQKTKFGDESD